MRHARMRTSVPATKDTPCARHQIISARGTRGTVLVSAPGSVSLSLPPLICAQERMEDPYMAQYYSGLFPRDNPRNTRCVSLCVRAFVRVRVTDGAAPWSTDLPSIFSRPSVWEVLHAYMHARTCMHAHAHT